MNFGLVDALHVAIDPLGEKLTDGLELLQTEVRLLAIQQAQTNNLLERLLAVETAKLTAQQSAKLQPKETT